jgi:ectoine hydroxylase-related dioxygenase (phytanoyl-CoA dioxygenase family)
MAKHPSPTNDPGVLRADLDRFGYALARKWLDPDEVSRTRDCVYEESQRLAAPSDRLANIEEWVIRGGDQWVLLMPGESGLDDLVAHPQALDLARHLLGQRIHISGFSAHVVHPGNEVMELHTDQWWMPRPVIPGETALRPGDVSRAVPCFGQPEPTDHAINPAVVINVMWALSDFTASSGCTRLVPGSHLSGVEPDPSQAWETVDAEVPAGGAVIWDARTWHASGANTGNGARMGISATYCTHQFRQLQNHTAGIKPDAHAALSDEMRELLGFRLFSSYGATDDFESEFARPSYLRD